MARTGDGADARRSAGAVAKSGDVLIAGTRACTACLTDGRPVAAGMASATPGRSSPELRQAQQAIMPAQPPEGGSAADAVGQGGLHLDLPVPG